jgi:alpha-beta hydrolase superfamily lysophospholipase
LGHLFWNIKGAWSDLIKSRIPTLVILGGDKEDLYIKNKEVRKWITAQKKRGSQIYTAICPGARHELDNEAKAKGGEDVRILTGQFFNKIIENNPQGFAKGQPLSICSQSL